MTFKIELTKALPKTWLKAVALLSLIPFSYTLGLRLVPAWIIDVASLFIGLIGAYAIVALAHERLKARGKNGWWLLIFFGPHVAMILALNEWMPSFASRTQYAVLVFSVIIAAPFLIWGMCELTAKPPQSLSAKPVSPTDA